MPTTAINTNNNDKKVTNGYIDVNNNKIQNQVSNTGAGKLRA